jgi:hypothetical protein
MKQLTSLKQLRKYMKNAPLPLSDYRVGEMCECILTSHSICCRCLDHELGLRYGQPTGDPDVFLLWAQPNLPDSIVSWYFGVDSEEDLQVVMELISKLRR